MVHWSAFPGVCFSGLFGVVKCLGGLQMAVVTGQASIWLEIVTQLARKLDHQINYYL